MYSPVCYSRLLYTNTIVKLFHLVNYDMCLSSVYQIQTSAQVKIFLLEQ